MTDTRIRDLGRKAELEQTRLTLETKIRLAVEQLALKADPHAPMADLDGDGMAELGVETAELLIQWRENEALLASIKRTLGIR